MTGPILRAAKSPRLEILDAIKRSNGLSAQDLADRLKLSYSSVKSQCEALVSEGFLDTWRRSKEQGRPEKTYRLTPASRDLHCGGAGALARDLLSHAGSLYGPTASGKLLFAWFEQRRGEYVRRVRGDNLEMRLRSLIRLREEEGRLPLLEKDPWHMVEYHDPLHDLRVQHPFIVRMETELVAAALGCSVRRNEESFSGLYRCEWMPG